jgi:hypothetical protein
MEVTGAGKRKVWLRSEAVLGIAPPEGDGGARLFLLSGEAFEVVEEQEELLGKLRELEGTARRDRRVGFPADDV